MYIAHCYPYTYSDLCQHIKSLEEDPVKKDRVKRKVLTPTIAGNKYAIKPKFLHLTTTSCEVLTITNFEDDFEKNRDKKGIVITARVHPGETQSSFVVEAIIDYLTGNTPEAKVLRDSYVFKVSIYLLAVAVS